ncbi:septum formation protein Maf [Candidatus Bathyarchaeota archaeon]|nr:MAG: septum formation protein Maf [Candidatus Bathyarchaeota archaeon]
MARRLKIVLASGSPRRMRLMEQLGVPFEVVEPGDVEESVSLEPAEAVEKNALAKAKSVARDLGEGIVIGADTVVVSGDKAFGKPRDPMEARGMLRSLEGSVHSVLTGIAVVDARSGMIESDVVETRVTMLPLSEADIEAYVATGEPLGKAGGYAIQGIGGVLVEGIEGCFYNVMGLPMSRMFEMLRGFGVDILRVAQMSNL